MPAAVESVFGPASVLMGGRAVGYAAAFAIPVVLVRIFDPVEFGTYKQLFLVCATLYGIAQVGMAESLFYFLPGEGRRGGRFACNSVLALGLSGGVCLAALWMARPSIGVWLNNHDLPPHIPMIGIYLLLTLAAAGLEIVMTVRRRHMDAARAYAISDLARTVLLIAPVLVFGSLEWLLIGAVAFALLRFCATLRYLLREFGDTFRPDLKLLGLQLAYALPFAAAVSLEVLQSNLHFFAVSFRFDSATFAIYAVGCLQIPLVDLLASSTGNVLMVRMREILKEGSASSVLAVWRDTTRSLALVFFPLTVALMILAQDLIVLLFTETYAASVPVFMLWVVPILLSALLTDAVLRVHAETRFLIHLNLVRLVIVAVLINGFITQFGLAGAVAVTVGAGAITKALVLRRLMQVMNCNLAGILPWGDLAATSACAAAAAAPALVVQWSLPLPRLPLLVATGAAYCAAYASLLCLYGPLRGAERARLVRWMRFPAAVVVRGWRSCGSG